MWTTYDVPSPFCKTHLYCGCSLLEGVRTRTRLISSPQVGAKDLLHSTCTANEGLVRIQCKCLVHICIPRNENCYFQNRILMFCLSVPTLIYLGEIYLYIYIFPGSVCLFCCRKYVDRSWEYKNRPQTHECGNWD